MGEPLIIFVMALAVVTLVGHGIWLALAAVFRAVAGVVDDRPTCPSCLARLPSGKTACGACGWKLEPRTVDERKLGLRQTKFEIDRLLATGKLTRERHEELRSRLADEWCELSAAQPRAAPVAAADEHAAHELAAAKRESAASGVVEPTAAPRDSSIPSDATTAIAPTNGALASEVVEAELVEVAAWGEAPIAQPPPPYEGRATIDALAAARAARFVAAQEAGGAERASDDAQRSARPTRTWGHIFAAFLEERNIRWGELVGGAIIVVCSAALVVSFWTRIAERPLLKFLVFNSVTAALFLLGLHAHRRWKLPNTAMGLLIIATMLVPLDFLAIAAVARGAAADWFTLAGEAASLALFAALAHAAAGVVAPRDRAWLTLGVMSSSVALLVAPRVVSPAISESMLLLVAGAPLAAAMLANGGMTWRVGRTPAVEDDDAAAALRAFALVAYALVPVWGLIVFRAGDAADAARRLAPLVSLAGVMPIVFGLSLRWRTSAAAARTAAASLAAAGAALLVVAVMAAWPHTARIVATASVAAAVLSATAWRARIAPAHVPACLAAAVAYAVALHAARGAIAWNADAAAALVRVLLSKETAWGLAPLVVAVWGVAIAARRRVTDARALALSGVLVAAVSLGLAAWFGLGRAGDAAQLTWVALVYAVGLASVAVALQSGAAAWAGAAVLAIAVCQGVAYRWELGLDRQATWLVAWLAYGTLSVGVACAARLGKSVPLEVLRAPFLRSSQMATALALVCWVLAAANTSSAWLAATMLWLSALVAAHAVLERDRWLFGIFQLAASAGVAYAVAAVLGRFEWYARGSRPWLDPWAIEAQVAALAIQSLGWLLARRFFEKEARGASLLTAMFDRAALVVVVAAAFLLPHYGAAVGGARELAPRGAFGTPNVARDAQGRPIPVERSLVVPAASRFEPRHMPHEHALGVGGWLLVGVALVVLMAGVATGDEPRWPRLWGMMLVGSSVCAVAAGAFGGQVAVASAYRWASAIYFALVSMGVWSARARLGEKLTSQLLWLACALVAAPIALMACFVAAGALALDPPTAANVDALRWLGFLWGVAVVAAVVIGFARFDRPRDAADEPASAARPNWQGVIATLVGVVGSAPWLAMGLYVAAVAIARHPIVGPDAASLFARMGLAASYTAPVFLAAATLVGHAVARRSAVLAFVSALLTNGGATAAYMMALGAKGVALSMAGWMRLAQVNALAASLFALAWLCAWLAWGRVVRASRAPSDAEPARDIGAVPTPLVTLVGMGLAFVALSLVAPTCRLWLVGDDVASARGQAGMADPFAVASDVTAWITLAMVAASAVLYAFAARIGWAIGGSFALALGVGTSLVCRLAAGGQSGWQAFHAMFALYALAAFAALAIGKWKWLYTPIRDMGETPPSFWARFRLGPAIVLSRDFTAVTRWGCVALVVTVLFALREWPQMSLASGSVRWPAAELFVAAALALSLAAWSTRRGFAYVFGALVNLAMVTLYSRLAHAMTRLHGHELFCVAVMALALAAVPSMFVEMMIDHFAWRRHRPWMVAFHRLAAVASTVAVAWVVAAWLVFGPGYTADRWDYIAMYAACAATFCACVATLWDRGARFTLAALYVLGLTACGLLVVDLEGDFRFFIAAMGLAAFTLVVSYLASRAAGVARLAEWLRVPRRGQWGRAPAWLVWSTALLTAGVMGLAIIAQSRLDDFSLRMTLAIAAIAQGAAIAMLGRATDAANRPPRVSEAGDGPEPLAWRMTSLAYLAIGCVVWGFAWQPVTADAYSRGVVAALALAVVASVYGLVPGRLLPGASAWAAAAERLARFVAIGCVMALGVVLWIEAARHQARGAVGATPFEIVAVAACLGLLTAAALMAAVTRGRDPFGLSGRGRTLYVYAAEVFLALVGLHLRLTAAWLFGDWLALYWPFATMALAMTGAGLAELCRRQGRMVLAEPLERTAAIMPVLPLVAYKLWPSQAPLSLVLVAAGVLYSLFAAARQNAWMSVLAALAFNGAWWHVLSTSPRLAFWEHPQFWLVPPAVCLLVGAQLTQDKLSRRRLASLRYLATSVIYLSSTVEIFLHGVAQHAWLPVALGGMAIAGMLAGMLLRVRAFLFMGTAFLAVALFSVLWYAAVDAGQTWVWYVTGIVAGAAMIAAFAVLEKRRARVVEVVERLKRWEA